MIEFAIIVILIGLDVWKTYQWSQERQKLLDRVQSGSLVEYKAVTTKKAEKKPKNEEPEVIEL